MSCCNQNEKTLSILTPQGLNIHRNNIKYQSIHKNDITLNNFCKSIANIYLILSIQNPYTIGLLP